MPFGPRLRQQLKPEEICNNNQRRPNRASSKHSSKGEPGPSKVTGSCCSGCCLICLAAASLQASEYDSCLGCRLDLFMEHLDMTVVQVIGTASEPVEAQHSPSALCRSNPPAPRHQHQGDCDHLRPCYERTTCLATVQLKLAYAQQTPCPAMQKFGHHVSNTLMILLSLQLRVRMLAI